MIDVALIHRRFGDSLTDPNSYRNLCSIGGIISVDCSKSLGKTIGTMDITLAALAVYTNTGTAREDKYFGENDSIDLYLSSTGLNTSSLINMYANNTSAFVFSGSIGSVNLIEQEGKRVLELTCADKTNVLTNINAQRSGWKTSEGYYVYKPTDTAHSAAHQLISEVNENMRLAYNEPNESGGDYWQNITFASDSDDCSNVSGFSALNIGFPFKTYAEIFNEFVSGAYTDDVQFTYWIDARNQMHIKRLRNTKNDDIVYGTDRIDSLKFKEDVYDTVNAAIVNAGTDLNGVGIWWYALNEANAAEVGLRWDIFADLMTGKDYASLTRGYDYGTATGVSGKVLTDSTKSWTPDDLIGKWLINPAPPNAFLITDNDGTTITVDGEGLKETDYIIYNGTNADFRTEVRDVALAKAKAALAKTAKLRYRGDIVLNGTLSHDLNEVFDIQQTYLGFTATSPKRMRLTDVAHNVADGSWKTTLTFKEDVGTEGTN